MAIPILPLMLLGVGALVLRGRKRGSKGKTKAKAKTKSDSPPIGPVRKMVFVPPPPNRAPDGPGGQAGQPCDAVDGKGAWDDAGSCRTFWIDGVTDEAIARLARQEWEARGRPSFSDLCLAVKDPLGGEFAAPGDSPRLTEIVVASLRRYYDVGPVFPPTEATQGHQASSPYWVHEAWAKANAVIRKELCGQ